MMRTLLPAHHHAPANIGRTLTDAHYSDNLVRYLTLVLLSERCARCSAGPRRVCRIPQVSGLVLGHEPGGQVENQGSAITLSATMSAQLVAYIALHDIPTISAGSCSFVSFNIIIIFFLCSRLLETSVQVRAPSFG